jgi:cysteine-rich repeat protein
MSRTALDSQAALEFVKVLQTLSIDRVALASMDLSATIETLAKLAGVSSGWVGHATVASYLSAIFENASPQYIPSILSAMTKSSMRSANDIIVGMPLEYKSGPNAAWQMGILSIMGVDLANASSPLPWQSNTAFNLRPRFLVFDRINAYVQPSDMILVQTNTFPLPWSNTRGPWVTPAVGVSLISRQTGSISLKHSSTEIRPLFEISLPLSLTKVSALNQRIDVAQKKLVPKLWNDVISAWVPGSCRLLGVSPLHCNITCDRLGLVAVEYDVTFFVCGDGVRDVGEECDDWNDKNGGGCDSQCQIEDGWSCQRGIYSVRKVRS